MKIKMSTIKEIKSLVDEDWKEIAGDLSLSADDIQTYSWRVISEDVIDAIQQEELANDEYMLGCFNDWFLADVLEDIDVDVIRAMQDAEAFVAIGKLVLSRNKLEELQQACMQADGYGYYFAHYDHEEHEININGTTYYFFRTN